MIQSDKELVCRGCGIFYNPNELQNSECPVCESEENLFINEND